MRLLPLVAAAGVALAVVACGLDRNGLGDDGTDAAGGPGSDATIGGGVDDASGSDDVTSSPPDTGMPLADGGGEDVRVIAEAGRDGGLDAGFEAGEEAGHDAGEDAGHDAGLDAADAHDSCSPVEICNNGIDDNCNGLVDCADPECNAGWACTPVAIPFGWTIAEYVETSRPPCSTGYGGAVDVLEGPTGGPATCGCACDLTPGSCETGNFSASSNAFGGTTCSALPVTSGGKGGACSPVTVDYTPGVGAMFEVTPAPYTAGSCAAQASETPPPPVAYAGQGVLCTDSTTSGGGCANGGVCAPAANGNGFDLCIVASGAQTCPAGFTKPHTIGTGVTDGRGCTACSCGGPTATCTDATLTLFPAAGCADGGVPVAANGTCAPFPGPSGVGAPTYVAFEYTAQVTGEACAPPSPVFADGGVSLTGVRTVCCQ